MMNSLWFQASMRSSKGPLKAENCMACVARTPFSDDHDDGVEAVWHRVDAVAATASVRATSRHRRDRAVRNGSTSTKKPPTSSEDGDDARRWRKVEISRWLRTGVRKRKIPLRVPLRLLREALLELLLEELLPGLGLADHLDRAVAEPAFCTCVGAAPRRRRAVHPHAIDGVRTIREATIPGDDWDAASHRAMKSLISAMSRCSASYFRCCSSSLILRSRTYES